MDENRYEIFGNDPLLDILHIAYIDLKRGRLTHAKKLEYLMFKYYTVDNNKYKKEQIRRVIDAVWDSHWLEHAGPNIHLTESGVAMYWNMYQFYKDKKMTEESFKLERKAFGYTRVFLVLTIISALAAIVQLILVLP